MYIDGRWEPAASGKTREIINPFNQQVIAEVAEGDREDAKRAIRRHGMHLTAEYGRIFRLVTGAIFFLSWLILSNAESEQLGQT